VSLSNGKYQLFGNRQSTGGTYCLILTIHTLAAFQLVAINVRNIGNGGVFTRSVLASVGNNWVCAHPKFSLEAKGQQSPYRSDRTHIKDMKNPVEVQLPGSNRLFILLLVITSRDQIPFTPLDDVPLDLVRSPD
jgi:hypothetical protein